MTKKELLGMTKKEIAQVAKEKGIARYKGKSMLTKYELIDKILVFEDINSDIKKLIEESGGKSEKNRNALDTIDIDRALLDEDEKTENVEDNSSGKQHYIDSIEVGTLVAFHDSEKGGKMNTAKVINKSSKNRQLKLETQYGKQYIIGYEDIAWVKTGNRWPAGIYRELKGIVVNE
jgi:hypothetical protein